MSFGRHAFGLSVVVSLYTATAHAQDTPLTLAEVLAHAREQAPQVVVARLAIDEARARVVGAAQRFQSNPDLDVIAGNRTGGEGRSTDFQIGVGQTLERGDRRTARRAAASAAVGQATATADDRRRLVLQAAAATYYRGLHAIERTRLLRVSQQLSDEIEAIAQRRFRAGDVAVLDANVARAAAARARAAVEASEAMRVDALGDLNQLLGTEGVTVQGSLASGLRDVDVPSLMASAEQRPDLGVIALAMEEAVAEGDQARTFQRPQYGVGAAYAREERDQIVMGTFTITLPVFARGQEADAAATARGAWRRAELDAARRRVRVEVQTASDVYLRRAAAASALEQQALSSVDENERLAARSFEVGQLGLADVLLLRREILDTRLQYVDALLEAALARVDVDASAAVLR